MQVRDLECGGARLSISSGPLLLSRPGLKLKGGGAPPRERALQLPVAALQLVAATARGGVALLQLWSSRVDG